jgi:membrane protein required for beta-lactamase induction
LFSILVLAYCLRYQPIDDDIDKISLALENRDVATASYLAREFLGEQPDTEADLVKQVCSALLVNVNERLFAVVLWFVILGPMGALLYRLSWFYSQQSIHAKGGFKASMSRLHTLLNWLPARLLPLGYAVAGSFDDALRGWKEVHARGIEDMESLNRAIITHTGCSALHVDRYIQPTDKPGFVELEVKAIQASHSLIMRAMLAWGIVIALLTLAGWAG